MEVTQVDEGQEFEPIEADGGVSLSARMAHRAEVLERQQTEWFPLPGWDDLIEVELKALGLPTIAKVNERNKRVRDPSIRTLYVLADQIVLATEGFREIKPDGTRREISDDWCALARRLPDCPDELTPRRAVLFLVGEKRIHFLIEEWGEWAKTVREGIEEEVERDFGMTG